MMKDESITYNRKTKEHILAQQLYLIAVHGYKYTAAHLTQERQSNNEYNILGYIYEYPGCCQDAVAKALHVDKSSIAKAISKAIRSGKIKREKVENDKRQYALTLTKQGIDIIEELIQKESEWQRELLSCLTDEEKKNLYTILEKMEDAISHQQ